jgi:hypothetical protein
VQVEEVEPGRERERKLEREHETATLRTEIATLQTYSAEPMRALASLSVNRAAQPSTDLAERQPAPAGQASPRRKRGTRFLKQLKRRDTLLSGAILVVSSLLYVGTIYSDTWGGLEDWVTAFGAGFLGHLTVKWALLPIYRSLRLRAAPETAAVEGAAAGIA